MAREAAKRLGINIEPAIDRIRTISDPIADFLLTLFDLLTEIEEAEAHDDAREIAEEHFKQKFAERTLTYPIFSLAALLIALIFDWQSNWTLTNQLYGLSLDFLGAIILGRGLLMGGIAIGAASSQRWGYNGLLVKSMAKDSVDGVWGVSLILIGILLQIMSFSLL